MAVTFEIEGTTKDGKRAKVIITLKKFCKCKPSHPNCAEDAKKLAPEKIKPVLARWESDKIYWLDDKIHPNFVVEVMEELTEVLEAVCVNAKSEHLQGAQVKVEFLD